MEAKSTDQELFGPVKVKVKGEGEGKDLTREVVEALERDEITEEVENALLDPETAGKVVTLAKEGTRQRLVSALTSRLGQRAA